MDERAYGLSPCGAQDEAEDLQEVKKWPVGERIGQGAFGDAFLVQDPKSKKKYVLKRIRMARQNEWQRSATRQEIKLGSLLQHPYIVRFVKSWIRDGHEVNIVYEYCSQGDLQTMLRKQKGKHVDERQIRRWLAEMLLALYYLQSKQVLHRDLKTSNIFLTADNDVLIGDFGLATIRDDEDCSTHDQSIVGTPHFMSPEVLNRKKYDFKTDIWSLGCVIYELSALRSPFNAFNLNGLVSKICKSAVAPLPSQYTDEWNSIIKWMLKKDATKRPSVQELLASEALRSDVLWARERAAMLSPGTDLPPLPTPQPLLRQLSNLSTSATLGQPLEDDVLCAGYDGTHTPVREAHGGSLDRLLSVQESELMAVGVGGVEEREYRRDPDLRAGSHTSDGSSEPVCHKELLSIAPPQAGAGQGAEAPGSTPSAALPHTGSGTLAVGGSQPKESKGMQPQHAAGASASGAPVATGGVVAGMAAAGARATTAPDRKTASVMRAHEAPAGPAPARPAVPGPAAAAGTKRTRRASALVTGAATTPTAAAGTALGAAPGPATAIAGPSSATAAAGDAAAAASTSAAVAARPRIIKPRAPVASREPGEVAKPGFVATAAANVAAKSAVTTRAAARSAAPTRGTGLATGTAGAPDAHCGSRHQLHGPGLPTAAAIVTAAPTASEHAAAGAVRMESMDVDGAAEPPPKKRSSPTGRAVTAGTDGHVTTTATAAPATGGLTKGVGESEKTGAEQGARVGTRATSAQRLWRANSMPRAAAAGGAVAERHGAATVAVAAAVPKYRDAAKAVAAAVEAAAVAAAAATAPTAKSLSTSQEAGAAAEVPPAPAAPRALAVASASAAAQPAGIRATAPVRMPRVKSAGIRASPVRRTTRSNSSGSRAAAVTAAGEASTATSGIAQAAAGARRRRESLAAAAAQQQVAPVSRRGRERTTFVRAPCAAAPSVRAGLRSTSVQQLQRHGEPSAASTASGASPACSLSNTSVTMTSGAASGLDPGHHTVESRPRRASYMSASGQLLCEEFSMLSLPPGQQLERSSSCSSLPGSNPPSTRPGRSCSTDGGLSPSPSPSPAPARPVAKHVTPVSRFADRMQAAVEGLSCSPGGKGAASVGTTPTESELSPAVGAVVGAYVAAAPAQQPPQLFDNQLFQSPNSRKASYRSTGGSGDGGDGSPSRSSMSCDVTGPERVVLAPGETLPSGLASGLPDAWGSASDALECPASFADLAAAGVVCRATHSPSSSVSSGPAAARRSLLLPGPHALGDATAVIVPSGGASELSFAGFKTALGTGAPTQLVSTDTATPALPSRTNSLQGGQQASTGDAMSVSFASHTDLMSVTRRLEMCSDDQASSMGAPPTPGSLGKWMSSTPGLSPLEAAKSGTTVQRGAQYSGGTGGGPATVLSPTGPAQRTHQGLLQGIAMGALTDREVESMRERLATLERVVDLASRLHAMGRWHELGSVLSSTQPRSSCSSEAGCQDAPCHPSPAPVPHITSPGGGSRALNVGDKVIVGSRRGIATIRYFGPTHWATGDYVGLELDRPEGKHTGEVDGICYFNCAPMHGIFVQAQMLKPACT